ncbi:MAG: single-stranded-DNA-specific exonuclease RecJ [Candidatus Saccharibacteria bacterium]
MSLFDKILAARGLTAESKAAFLAPDYSRVYDPFLLPDMDKAVDRLVMARQLQEKITIYGDYDIDGLTASTLLLDAFGSFGFSTVNVTVPSRFVEGFGLTMDAVRKIAADGTKLIVTVDCGSLSEKEIIHANKLGVDVIVTDHHNAAINQPPAIAIVNPKRSDNQYPFINLAGVGVAFKLVQALQTKLDGLPNGHEKWLLDLVALGTVCDVVDLIDENRTAVFWGLRVLAKAKRPGLKALMAVAGVDPKIVNTRSLGFMLGPRMNAAGRLETAQHALDLLLTSDPMSALEKAQYLDDLNKSRQFDQKKILKEAIAEVDRYTDDPVLVVSGADWNHGVVGIVASKLLEKYKKPTFVLQEMGDESKGSARSYGDFSAADAISYSEDIITKGGGHKLAAGITLPTKNISAFRKRVNEFYKSQKLIDQRSLLLPQADALAELHEVTEELVGLINQLEPFGCGNLQPILRSNNLTVVNVREMGTDARHVKLELRDDSGYKMQFIAFNAPDYFFVKSGERLSVWYQPDINEWQGRRSVEGRLLHLEIS